MHKQLQLSAGPLAPYLEHCPEQGGVPHRIPLYHFPFRLGRSKTANWVIGSARVSKDHAEIVQVGEEFRIRDLGSTNGTFVNGKQVTDCRLADRDIVHLGNAEFLFSFEHAQATDTAPGVLTDPLTGRLPASVIRGGEHLRALLTRQSVTAVFQPIVGLPPGEPMGFEALGRGDHPELSTSPAALLRLADKCRLAAELSRTFRREAVEQARYLPWNARVFLNTHPAEMSEGALLKEMRRLRPLFRPDQHVVLEMHEHALTDLSAMRRLKEQLRDLDIGIAFDDFGAGQSRLLELTETPPDFIKLDRSLIYGIDRAGARHEVVQALCRISRDLGVQIIAEGIETPAEARTCQTLGCHFGQGYLFGRPQPTSLLGTDWLDARKNTAQIRCLFGDPCHPIRVSAAWLDWNGGTIRELAHAVYAHRILPAGTLDPARLAVLADALEEAGCEADAILGHLRGPGPHVKGCHVLDALQGAAAGQGREHLLPDMRRPTPST